LSCFCALNKITNRLLSTSTNITTLAFIADISVIFVHSLLLMRKFMFFSSLMLLSVLSGLPLKEVFARQPFCLLLLESFRCIFVVIVIVITTIIIIIFFIDKCNFNGLCVFLVLQSVICLHRKVFSRDHKLVYWIAGGVSALSVLLEKKARRGELALYVLPRAGDSLWYILVNRHLLPNIRNAEVYPPDLIYIFIFFI